MPMTSCPARMGGLTASVDYQALTPSKRASGFLNRFGGNNIDRCPSRSKHWAWSALRHEVFLVGNEKVNENKNNWFNAGAFGRGSRNVFRGQPDRGHVETERKQIHLRRRRRQDHPGGVGESWRPAKMHGRRN